jgi:hypothetical protein
MKCRDYCKIGSVVNDDKDWKKKGHKLKKLKRKRMIGVKKKFPFHKM